MKYVYFKPHNGLFLKHAVLLAKTEKEIVLSKPNQVVVMPKLNQKACKTES